MGVADSEEKQLLGSFSVGEGSDLSGLLTLSEDGVSLFVWNTNMISPKTISSTISGVLHDNRIVTLFDCVPTGHEGTLISGRGMTSRTTISANHAVYGSVSLDPSKKCVNRVRFRTDDTNLLFNDREAFALKPSSEQDPSIRATYSGIELISCVDTSIGRVSAFRTTPIEDSIDVSEGISISSKVSVEVEFDNAVTYYDAIRRGTVLVSFLSLLIGRPQNLVALRIEVLPRPAEDRREWFAVEITAFPRFKRHSADDGARIIRGRLIDPVKDRERFESVLANWLSRHDEWRHARSRYDRCAWNEREYHEDRMIGAANMFDLIPDDAVGPKGVIPEKSARAIAECKRILKSARTDRCDNDDPCNEALRWIGMIKHKSLRQKICFRAEIVLRRVGCFFPDLEIVIDEAVKCRNIYVHGISDRRSVDYPDPGVMVFLINTLEFVFVASDLVDAGWDVSEWIERRMFSHRFEHYVRNYDSKLNALRANRESR